MMDVTTVLGLSPERPRMACEYPNTCIWSRYPLRQNKTWTYIVCQLKVLLTCQLIVHSFNQLQDLQQWVEHRKREVQKHQRLSNCYTSDTGTEHFHVLLPTFFRFCTLVIKIVLIGFRSTTYTNIPHKSLRQQRVHPSGNLCECNQNGSR